MGTLFLISVVCFAQLLKADSTININLNGLMPQVPSAPAAAQPTQPAPKVVTHVCSVKAFMDEFSAVGNNKFEVRKHVSDQCKAKNSDIHCKDISCESEEVVPGVNWECKYSAFTDTFEGTATTKLEAKYKAKKDCVAKNNEMHCRLENCESDKD